MTESVRRHLPIIVVVSIVGIVTGYFALMRVYASASGMDVDTFSTWLFGVPCVVIFICSTVIVLTAHEISRQLYVVVVAISMVIGILSVFLSSFWFADPNISTQLLANSPNGTEIKPLLDQPITVLRDIAAFFVLPTIGCILGAWIGSRLHPMTSESLNKKKSKKKNH